MQTRLLATIAGALLGVASPLSSALDLTPALGLIVSSAAGGAVGYVASILLDVFAAKSGDFAGSQK
jgi:hypothetical protein